ncbi:hypothetical protein ACOSP7_007314 [Xanthoceras sorbifolium]
MAQSPVAAADPHCSICWEEMSDTCGRTVVTLQCSHQFHLDCIGSAFNMSGIMQCPNCRQVENGEWRRFENTGPNMEQDPPEEEHQDIEMENHGEHWCPYHGRVIGLPALAPEGIDEVQPIFGGDLNQANPALMPEVAIPHIAMNNHNEARGPFGAVFGPQGDAGGLPDYYRANRRFLVNQGNGYNNMHGFFPAGHVPAPAPAPVRPQEMGGFYFNIHNNHPHPALHGGHALNLKNAEPPSRRTRLLFRPPS